MKNPISVGAETELDHLDCLGTHRILAGEPLNSLSVPSQRPLSTESHLLLHRSTVAR